MSQSNPPNDSDRKSKPTVTVQQTALGTGSIHDLPIGTTKRRRSSVGSPFHRRAQSTDRQPRTTEQMSLPRPASATGRARSVDPLGPDLGRTLPLSASRSRERPAKDVLIIARNKEGKHRVKDSPKQQDVKINSAEGAAPLNDNLPTKYPQQQQQSKIKASRMLINTNKLHPIKPRPLLVRSTSSSLESKEDVECPEAHSSSNHELRRTASIGSTTVTTEPDSDRTTAGTVEFSSPLSPTTPDLLLDEYRKIGLGIQDLIKNAEDLDNSRCKSDGQSNSKVSDDDRNLLNLLEASPNRNETLAETRKTASMTTRLPSANSINSTSRIEQPAGQGQTDGHGRSSSAAVFDDKANAGAPRPNVSGLEKNPGLGAAVERSRCTVKAANRKVARTRSSSREPVKEMTLPRSSSITRNQRPLSCTSRTRGRTMDEDCESGGSKRNNADIRVDPQRMGHEEEDSSQHRSRATFASNRDKGLSGGSGDFVSDATRQNAVSTPLRKPRAASNSRCPSTEPDHRRPDVTSQHAADDTDHGLSTNVDGYCRKALLRKDIVSGQKTSSRIPMPLEVRQSLQFNIGHKGYGSGQLKRVDSGVDINNISP